MRKLVISIAVLGMILGFAAYSRAKDLNVGFVYVTPIGDAGWSYAHDLGRKEIAKMPGVKTSYVEAVAEGPDAERVILNMARKDYDVIIATSYGYMDSMIRVAQKYPKTVFLHCSGYKRSANVGTFMGREYQARYLAGMVAGGMTKSNIIGYVAAFPIPEVIRGINAYALGAQAVNPKAQVRVVWTKTWYDPATEKDAAVSLLDAGADVLGMHQDSPATQLAAQERGGFSTGNNSDMSALAPKAHLTSPVFNWGAIYKYMIENIQKGTWKSEDIWWGLEKNVVDISPMGAMVPKVLKDKVLARKAEIASGKTDVFVGPVKDQSGKVIVPAGQKAADKDLLGMTWFVQGVVGSPK